MKVYAIVALIASFGLAMAVGGGMMLPPNRELGFYIWLASFLGYAVTYGFGRWRVKP